MTESNRGYPRTIDYAFAALSLAEASHAIYMLRTLVDRAKRDEVFSEREVAEWANRLSDRTRATMHALGVCRDCGKLNTTLDEGARCIQCHGARAMTETRQEGG